MKSILGTETSSPSEALAKEGLQRTPGFSHRFAGWRIRWLNLAGSFVKNLQWAHYKNLQKEFPLVVFGRFVYLVV